jgi:hypothetical protein
MKSNRVDGDKKKGSTSSFKNPKNTLGFKKLQIDIPNDEPLECGTSSSQSQVDQKSADQMKNGLSSSKFLSQLSTPKNQ